MLLNKRLEHMKNGLYLYNAKQYRIIDYRINADNVIVSTDRMLFIWNHAEAELKLSEFMPVEEELSNLPMVINNDEAKNLVSVLMDNINKVQTNPEYIKVADSINRTTATLINLVKTALIVNKMKNGK